MISATAHSSGEAPQMRQPDKPNRSGYWRWLFFFVVVVVAGIVIYWKFDDIAGVFQRPVLREANEVLFTVGTETIYASDLAYEKSNYPTSVSPEVEAALKSKLQEDSIVLQEAQKQNLLSLDSNFFNAATKDYQQRLRQISTAKQLLLEKTLQSNYGEAIAIWFMNTEPAPIGYDAAKKLAFTKISDVRARVASSELTMQEAGQLVASDTSLAQVDPAYQSNAYFDFVIVPNQKVVFEDRADVIIKNTKPGQMTDILVLQDKVGTTTERKDALYLFAKIADTTSTDPDSFSAWLATVKPSYVITE